MISYTVKAGDTLALIARQYLGNSLRYPELARFNNIANPNVIYIGQTINIPEAADLQEISVTAQKIPDPYAVASDAPLPGVFELETIEGSAPRNWIIPILAAAAIYWGISSKGRI